MTDFHVITSRSTDHILSVVNGEVLIVPLPAQSWSEIASATTLVNPNLRGDERGRVRPAAESKEF